MKNTCSSCFFGGDPSYREFYSTHGILSIPIGFQQKYNLWSSALSPKIQIFRRHSASENSEPTVPGKEPPPLPHPIPTLPPPPPPTPTQRPVMVFFLKPYPNPTPRHGVLPKTLPKPHTPSWCSCEILTSNPHPVMVFL